MFKKLFFISISVLVLTGCGEKGEITPDMLAAKWHCKYIDYKEAKGSVDGINFNYQDTPQTEILKQKSYDIEFKKIGNNQMAWRIKGENIYKTYDFALKVTMQLLPIDGSEDDNSIDRFIREYKYINNNKFELITTRESLSYTKEHKLDNASWSNVSTAECTRIGR